VSEESIVSNLFVSEEANSQKKSLLEKEIEALKEELKQTKLAYEMAKEMSHFKAGFLARTSHELRSPLSSLMGMHQLILSDLCDSPEEEREFLAQAHISAQKMVKLLDEVIAIAKTEQGTSKLEIRPLSLTQIFEEIEVLTHMQAANRNLQLKVISPAQDIQVLADPRRFRQVLLGLVDSTIAQMDEGTIQVSAVCSTDTQQVSIWIDVRCPNPIWHEPVDLLSQEPKAETKPDKNVKLAPGLNLFMVKILVEVMDGRIELLAIPDNETAGDMVGKTITRIQCSMPLATPEAGE
jgi:hypothetical protein